MSMPCSDVILEFRVCEFINKSTILHDMLVSVKENKQCSVAMLIIVCTEVTPTSDNNLIKKICQEKPLQFNRK